MFTGIIQTVGTIRKLENQGDALRMLMEAPQFFLAGKPGDSVANDGVCLTIEECTSDTAWFTLIHQTVQTTAFQVRQEGSRVNLELPCRADALMGGHYVMGHVDSTATVLEHIERETGVEIVLELPEQLSRYVIQKGSISLNGISLTVAEKQNCQIRVALIPETLAKTNVLDWQKGHPVNVEVDMIGKYVENFLTQAGIVPNINPET